MDWIEGVDWLRVGSIAWSFVWPIVVAIPGMFAFVWQWQDRRLKPPHIEVRTLYDKGLRDCDGWVPVRFLIRNDAEVPITITRLEIVRPKGVEFAPMGHSNSPNLEDAGSIRSAKWRVEADLHAAPKGERWSAQTSGFLGSTLRNNSEVQVSIRITFSEMAATRRQRTIRITTDAIKLPLATKRKTS